MKNECKYCEYLPLTKSNLILSIVLIMISCFPVIGQIDTVHIPGDVAPGEGKLNYEINKVLKSGKLSNTVFKLELNSNYILTDSIFVPAGGQLTIIADEPGLTQETSPPQILWTSNTSVKRNYFIYCLGNLALRNIWLYSGDTNGNQVGSCIYFANDLSSSYRLCDLENVILDYFPISISSGGAVTVACKNFNGIFRNCYWKNCTDQHFRYYGRAVSFPYNTTGWHGDSIIFENCTFANIGYVLMQEEGEYFDNVKFNHCTFFNVVMYSLESGWWYKLSLTNSLFVNTWMYGDLPVFSSYEGQPEGGTLKIDSVASFGFPVPFTDNNRQILFTNSSYHIEKWLEDWMWNNPGSIINRNNNQYDYVPVRQPMMNNRTHNFFESTDSKGDKTFPLINKSDLYDSTDPGFILPPTDTIALKNFLYHRWWDSADTNWAYFPELSLQHKWPLHENLSYTNETLLNAGISGFPLGDLFRWFPNKYSEWKTQEDFENKKIKTWLETGKDTYVSVKNEESIPTEITLYQNYPNPFNPVTKIKYSIPVETRRASMLSG